jgi:hypothetical protein
LAVSLAGSPQEVELNNESALNCGVFSKMPAPIFFRPKKSYVFEATSESSPLWRFIRLRHILPPVTGTQARSFGS